MSAKPKSDACVRRYTKGIKSMSSKAKSDAHARMPTKLKSYWEVKVAKFETYVRMPLRGT